MKTLWILSVLIGLIGSEKLDRVYLPPPGSKFSGGSPGDLDVPLELPKEAYPSRSGDNNFGRPEIAIGIDRVSPNIPPEKYGDITPTVPSFNENTFAFPTTTTSYAFSQTTSYLPAAGSTIGPEMSINSKYPNSISINNSTPGYLRETYLSFDDNKPHSIYNTLEKDKVLNDDTNSFENFENHFLDNGIHSQVVQKISDESVHSYNDHVISIPESYSHPGDLGIQGISSSPSKIDHHSLFNNNYDTYQSARPSKLINQKDVNPISSTPIPSNNVYSETLPNSPISITNTPYSYRTLPGRAESQDREAVILNYENTITPDGYAYSFDTSNGIHADEKGTTINGVQAVGSYSYIGDDGQLYNVSYTADVNGFRPHGAHLPTAPPIPDAILKVIEQAAIDKANGIYHDGSYDENKYGYRKYIPLKNNQSLNQYKNDREGDKLDGNLDKDNDTIQGNKQNIIQLQPFKKNELDNNSLSEISPNYKSKHYENIEKDHETSNNNKNNNLQNNISNHVPHLEDKGNDKMMSIDIYDDTGYHYSKPQNSYSLKASDNVRNRFSEPPASNKIPATYEKKVETLPVRPFMTPYVSRNDVISTKHDGDDQTLDIPAKYHEEDDVILSNQRNNLPFAKTKMVLGTAETDNIQDYINKFKQTDLSTSNDQGYLYNKKGNSNNDSLSYSTSTENGISEITSTLPTFPSRLNIIEHKGSQNPLKYSDSGLVQEALPNHPLDQEKYKTPLTHLNKLNSYGNYNDKNDAGPGYKIPNIYEGDKDYTIEHSTTKTYTGEDFSGPKRVETYDPLTGYHY